MDKLLVKRIIKYHSMGMNNKEIANKVNRHVATVYSYLYRLGLRSNLNRSEKVKLSNSTEAQCSRCGKIKPTDEFFIGRKGKSDPYRYSYCKTCRGQRIKYNMNTNIESYIGYRVESLSKRTRTPKDRRLGLPFNLTKEYVLDMLRAQKGKCFYTNYPLVCKYGEGLCDNTLSFDRIIHDKGYVKGNVVICTMKANSVKRNLSLLELKKWLPSWYKKLIKNGFITPLAK